MPAVPVAPLPSQELKPQQAPGYTGEDFGAGTGRAMMQVGQTLQNSGEQMFRHVEERRVRDNETKALEAATDLHNQYREANYGENGFSTRRGENAVGVTVEAQKKFDEINRGVAEKYKDNPAVAAQVGKMATNLSTSTLDSLKPHEENQRIAAADDASSALVKSSSIDAANAAIGPDGNPDAGIIQRSVNTARAAVLKIARDRGENGEAARLRILNADSAIHSSVIDRLLVTDPVKAAAYYSANSGSINGSDHARLQGAIKQKTDAYADDADTQRITGQSTGTHKLASSILAIDVPSSGDYVASNIGAGTATTAPAPAPAPAGGAPAGLTGAAAANATRLEGDPLVADVPLPPKRPAGLGAPEAPAAAAGGVLSPGAGIAGSKASAAVTGGAGAGVEALAPSVQHGETGGSKPGAISSTGAAGVMQVQPGTAIDISTKMLKDGLFPVGTSDAHIQEALSANPALAQRYGKAYLQFLSDRYHGDVEAVLVGYNAGPGNADKWLKAGRDYKALPDPRQTEPYVSKVLSHFTGATGGAPGVQQRAASAAGVTLPPLGRDMDKGNWALSFYKPEDMLAPTAGGQHVDARAATMADILGKAFFDSTGIRVGINDTGGGPGTAGKRRGSADPSDNPHVANSQHIHGRAFDFQIQSLTPPQKAEFLRTARAIGFTGVGFYDKGDKAGHLHLDAGTARSWGSVPGWAAGAMATAPAPSGTFGLTGVVSRNDPTPVPVRTMPGTVPTNAPIGSSETPAFAAPAGILGATPDASVGGVGAPAVAAPVTMPDTTPRLAAAANERPNPAMLTQWESEAMQIADPTRRASVLGKVRSEYARRLALAEQGEKTAFNDAFKQVVQKKIEPKDIPPDQLAAMGAQNAKHILDWHETMKKQAQPDQDWKTWGELSTMTDNELAKRSVFEFRNKLDDAHFDKLAERFKAITGKGEEAMNTLHGVSSRAELVDEALQELAGTGRLTDWKKQGANMAIAGRLNSQLDSEIAAYTREHKKAPNIEDQRKIVDRLMVKTSKSGGFLGIGQGDTRAFQVDPETAKDQVTPEATIKTYKDVPAADRVAIKSMWSDGAGKPPTEKELVDLYPQIVRARFGLKQISDPPAHEKPEVENALAKKYGRKPTRDETRAFWGRILQDKFGGK